MASPFDFPWGKCERLPAFILISVYYYLFFESIVDLQFVSLSALLVLTILMCEKWYHIVVFGFFFLVFSGVAPAAYGGSQARGLIRAVDAGLRHSHRNAGFEPHQ